MKYIIANPLQFRFVWETRVQIVNFLNLGVSPQDLYYVFMMTGNVEKAAPFLEGLIQEFPEVNFKLYEDFRDDRYRHEYQPTCRPHVMKQFAGEHPDIVSKAFMYLDSDVIFLKKPDFDNLVFGDHWYGSNVSSYIGKDYILKYRGPHIVGDMASIVGVSAKKVMEAQDDSIIGAQIIMKNADEAFWAEVEKSSYQLFKYLRESSDYYADQFRKNVREHIRKTSNLNEQKPIDYAPIQAWTADMWAVLWGAWKRGYETKAVPSMDFIMATEEIKGDETRTIYHNNGIQKFENGKIDSTVKFHAGNAFYKHDYLEKSPFESNLTHVSPYSTSMHYVKAVNAYKLWKKQKSLTPLQTE